MISKLSAADRKRLSQLRSAIQALRKARKEELLATLAQADLVIGRILRET